jgi:hypothetical protein
MKPIIVIAATFGLLAACDSRVSTAPAEKVTEKETTIINPPAKEEKKVENNTTIINPPAPAPTEEKKSSPK